jgi:hypothetical protein
MGSHVLNLKDLCARPGARFADQVLDSQIKRFSPTLHIGHHFGTRWLAVQLKLTERGSRKNSRPISAGTDYFVGGGTGDVRWPLRSARKYLELCGLRSKPPRPTVNRCSSSGVCRIPRFRLEVWRPMHQLIRASSWRSGNQNNSIAGESFVLFTAPPATAR